MRTTLVRPSMLLGAGLLFAVAPLAATSLQVTAAAALEGNFGLEIVRDGNTGFAYVEDRSPSQESCGTIRFRIDPNSVAMPNSTIEAILVGNGNDPGGGSAVFRVYLLRSTNGTYRVRAFGRIDDGVGADWARTKSVTIGDAARQVQVEWCKATALGANDGFIRITRLDNGLTQEVTGIDSDERDWRRTKFGLVTSIDPGIVGSIYLDDFQSFRN